MSEPFIAAQGVAAATDHAWHSAGAGTDEGACVGVIAALVVTRLLRQMLYEVNPGDPLIYLAVAAALLLVAELAAWLPARRATRIDPVIALRSE